VTDDGGMLGATPRNASDDAVVDSSVWVTWGWVVTRLALLTVLFTLESRVVGDITYFGRSLADLPDVGLGRTLREYPLLAVGVLAVPWWVARLTGLVYGLVFVLAALLVDGAFTAALARQRGPGRVSLVVWLAGVPAMGALAYARFDLVPGVLVAAVVLLHARHPRVAALCLALAVGVKLWPVLLVPLLVARVRDRRGVLGVIVGTGVVLVAATTLLAGAARVWSPLAYQSDRGLQVESVVATPVMLARSVHGATWTVGYASSKAYEISGPGVHALLLVSTVLSAGSAVVLLVAWVRAFRLPAGALTSDAFVWLVLFSVLAFTCTSKVLSPQYLLWLLPVAAAGLTVVSDRAVLGRWCAVLVVAMVLSQAVFPWLYGPLVLDPGSAPWRATATLVLRNLVLVWLMVAAGRRASAALRPGQS